MSKPRTSPSLRRRRLARELKRLRLAADVKQEHAATHIQLVHSSMSRIESGRQGIKAPAVAALLEFYGVPVEQRASLVKLAREAGQRGWWDEYRDVLSNETSAYLDFETEATSIRTFECQVVPGLLQTEEYARTVIAETAVGVTEDDVTRAAKVRTARQERFTSDRPLEFSAILDESALRRRTGGSKTMADQLTHILDLAGRSGIIVQVLPLGLGAHPGMVGAFSLIEFPEEEDPDVVYTEGVAGETYLEKPADVRRCAVLFERLRSAALGPEPSADLIASIIEELKRE